eukprot:TRINITY_DN496_c0_g1_i1.p1 TRINITY_DN496_c0_g1~~TRINITY_DN496_c0_g1_i1.p1  ORF type:complete len:405 (-),score=18.69 TRINITY_DN496_c0_g1_i1:337-1551(-)
MNAFPTGYSAFWETSPDDFSARFRLGNRLGQGQLGVVHVCHDRTTGEIVGACKSMPKHKLKSRSMFKVVTSEIVAMQKVSGHRNVVQLKGVFEDELSVHLIVDICMEGDLFKFLSAVGRLEEGSAARLLQQILLGLQYCHEKGVIHRDLKPENILITEFAPAGPHGKVEPQVKLGDFGFAASVSAGEMASGFFGSPLYMAPEVIRRAPYGGAVDVWSAGVILYIALCGSMPFYGSDPEVFAKVLAEHFMVDFISHPWDRINPMAIDLVTRMLHVDPSSRISIQEALKHPWMELHCSSFSVCRKDSLKEKQARLRALRSGNRSFMRAEQGKSDPAANPRLQDAAPSLEAHDANGSAKTPSTASCSSPLHSSNLFISPRTPFDVFFSTPRDTATPSALSRKVNAES